MLIKTSNNSDLVEAKTKYFILGSQDYRWEAQVQENTLVVFHRLQNGRGL